MKSRSFFIALLAAIVLLSACSPFTPVDRSTSYQDRAPIIGLQSPDSGYQRVVVKEVQVDVGLGSPIPVDVRVHGILPDQCSQLEYSTIQQDGTNFDVQLSAVPGGPDCAKNTAPFILSIPLNAVDLPAGSYSATVNGVRGEFTLQTGTSPHDLRKADWPFVKRDIQVRNVSIVIGPGSPLPVHAIVSGELPSSCAWLGEMRLHRDQYTYFVQLLAYLPAESECSPDPLPFWLELPLSTLNLPDGSYSVNVNGTGAGFKLPVKPEAAEPPSLVAPEAPIPAGWVTDSSQQCEYAISHPAEMEVTAQDPYSRTLQFRAAVPEEGARNFLYVSSVTPEIQERVKHGAYRNEVYNYDPAVTDILLSIQVGESKSVSQLASLDSTFTYQRRPDVLISGQVAQAYENLRPWEFPAGTKEIRYYVSLNGCTYLMGGYVDTSGSGGPGAISEDLFHRVIGTLRLMP